MLRLAPALKTILAVVLVSGGTPVLAESSPAPQAEVVRNGDQWTVTFRLDRDTKAWGFRQSNLLRRARTSWRVGSWQVLTPGVRLQRIGSFDALVAERGTVPREVMIAFPLESRDLLASYDPALVFSTGGVALYSGHFTLMPLDIEGQRLLDIGQTAVRFIDKGNTLWVAGQRYESATLLGDPRYQLFGDDEPVEGDNFSLLIDAGLPSWIRAQLTDFAPEIIDSYTARLGTPRLRGKPRIWATWGGTEETGYSLSGSVLSGQIVMALSGGLLTEPSDKTLVGVQSFIAHEAAHFWFGQTLSYAEQSDAWFTEGGANVAALNVLPRLDSPFDPNQELAKYAEGCRADARAGSIETAQARQQFDIYYNCGALFHLVAGKLAEADGRDWWAFNRWLISRHRDTRKISTEQWIEGIEFLDAPRTVVLAIRAIRSSDRISRRLDAVETLLGFLDLADLPSQEAA